MKPVLVTTAILAGTLLIASGYFYDIAIARGSKGFLENNPDLKGSTSSERDQEVKKDKKPPERNHAQWLESKDYRIWQIESFDGLKLSAYFIPATTPSRRTVISAHGYTSNAKHMAQFARFFNEKLGFNVLLPDARGHGESEGDYIGFGWHERKDYLHWIDKVIDTLGSDSQIVLHGISMGGATVMMVSGEELPFQVKAIIEDCGYTSVDKELSYQLKRMYHLPSFPLINTTSVVTSFKAGYNFYEASALKQIKKNQLPILFIHGQVDTFVPTEMVYELYEACTSEKDLYIVEGAGHGTAYITDTPRYEKRVTEFLKKHLD